MINRKAQAIFELSLLVLATFAFAYIINQNDSAQISKFQEDNFSSSLTKKVLDKFSSPMFPLASAIEGCCAQTKTGATCGYIDEADCSVGSSFATGQQCSTTSFCKKGCCIDATDGSCGANSVRTTCESAGGSWNVDNNCNQEECEKGCCKLGSEAFWKNELECQIYSESLGMGSGSGTLWDPEMNELECILSVSERILGACTSDNNEGKKSCQLLTDEECFRQTGTLDTFYEGKLCTAPELNTICEKTTETTCVEGKDGVYFKDSCGNTANIYDSSKSNDETYWTNIVSPQNSCNSGSGNENSKDCGNCNSILGGRCSSALKDKFTPTSGSNYCKPTTCTENGITYKNGESWCVYESAIGEGRDVVGSSHQLHLCNDGTIGKEVKEARGQICVQQDTTNLDGTTISFRTSAWQTNPWTTCLDLNEEINEESTAACNENPSCMIKGVKVDKFSFDLCVPQYPKGFDLITKEKSKIEKQEEVCAIGTQTCTVVYQKQFDDFKFKYICVQNCACEKTNQFTEQMNDFCTSLGDCGGYVNVEGVYTDKGYKISRASKIGQAKIDSYTLNKAPIVGLFARPSINWTSTGALLMSVNQGPSVKNPDYKKEGMQIYAVIILVTGGFPDEISYLAGGWLAGYIFDWFVTDVLGLGDTKMKYVTFTCKPWQPPIGGDDCEKCNEDPETCTTYKCASLGTACEILNKGEEDEMCFAKKYESIFPIISMGEAPEGLTFTSTGTGYEVKTSEGDCVKSYENHTLSFTTDEPAQCRFSLELVDRNSWDNMSDFGTNSFVRNHELNHFFLNDAAGQSQGVNISNEQDFYVLCQDVHGNMVPLPYKIETCVYEGKDLTGSRIILPENKLLSYHMTELLLKIHTSEPADCKYSTRDGTPYSEMNNTFECEQNIFERKLRGYECNTTIKIVSPETNIYIRCLDQPWLENAQDRAVSAQANLILRKVTTPIKIDSLAPNGELETNTDLKTITLGVQTSGGGNTHTCEYFWEGYSRNWNEMQETGKIVHKQEGLQTPTGENKIKVICEDETGDKAEAETTFTIVKDDKAPKIARIFKQDSSIKVFTVEKAD
jgi:hypothetical protein